MAGRATLAGEVEYIERGTTAPPERILRVKLPDPIPILKLRVRDGAGSHLQVLYRGDAPGHLDLGDEVQIEGVLEAGLIRAERIFNQTTNSWVTPKDCFIVTAVVGPNAYEVHLLRRYRGQVLERARWGRHLLRLYDRYSPQLAARVKKHPLLRYAVRWSVVKPAAWIAALLVKDVHSRTI